MRKWQQSQCLSATLNYTSAHCGWDSVQNLSKRHCVVTLWYTVMCHTVCNKNPKLTRRVQMTGRCVNYEASCKITRRCVGTRVCACSETTTLSARVRSRGMECEEPQAEDFEGFQPPLKKFLVCFGEGKREVAFSSGSERKAISHRYSMQLLKCLQMFFPLRILCMHTHEYPHDIL